MGHSHDHHHHDHNHGSSKRISIAFFINLIFTIIEIIGGLYTNSVSILSDALHDLGDSFSLGLAWYLQKYSNKEKNEQYTYGYKRYSVLGALINSLILIIGSIYIIYEAISRLAQPEAVDAKGMIFFALLGILFNGIAYYSIHKSDNINEKVVSLHLLEDVLGWVAVFIGSILIYFFDLPIIDPILSVLISLFILYNVFRNLNKSISIIMQGTPDNIDLGKLEKSLLDIEKIQGVHDLRVWTMDGRYNVMTVHAVLIDSVMPESLKELKNEIKARAKKYDIEHVTIEFESNDEVCEMINHEV